MELLTSDIWHIIKHPRGLVDKNLVEYAFFPTCSTGFSKPICVLTAHPGEVADLAFDVEYLIQAICKKHGADWRDVVWCHLETQHEFDKPSGYYNFEVICLMPYELDPGYCLTGWLPVECPFVVFDAFEHLIGQFWTIYQVVSPLNSLTGILYEDCTKEELAKEIAWMKQHLTKISKHSWKELEMYRNMMLTVEQAHLYGLHFDPRRVRVRTLPVNMQEWNRKEVFFVDLANSHLLGQYKPFRMLRHDEMYQPKRFSIWGMPRE